MSTCAVADQLSRLPVAVARSKRCEAIARRNAAEGTKQFRIHNAKCTIYHSERSESTNVASACGLCRARRRKTNEVQSRICLRILLYRFFVALLLRMTNYSLFANSAADWNMQLAATQKGWREKMFGAAAAYRAKHRLQPCEPKPRPAEARKTRSAGFGTRTTPIPLSKPIIACELQNRQKPAQNNRKRTTIFLIPSRAITPPADC